MIRRLKYQNPPIKLEEPERVGLIIDQRKWECADCGGSFWEDLDFVVKVDRQGRMTKRLRDYIAEKAKVSNWTDIEDELNISDTTIMKICHQEVAKLPPYYETEPPTILVIDEIFVRRPDKEARKVAWAIICLVEHIIQGIGVHGIIAKSLVGLIFHKAGHFWISRHINRCTVNG